MGYTTDFKGQFAVSPPLKPEHVAYINAFSGTRRMKRDGRKATPLPDPVRLAAGLPVGPSGSYFVGGVGFAGQDHDNSVLEHNTPPSTQPSLWCQWKATEDGTAIEWDGGEKFYEYIEWICYLVHHFFAPWGYTLNGEVRWQGESDDDKGKIIITNNVVTTKNGRVVYT